MADDEVKLDDLKGKYVCLEVEINNERYNFQVKFEDEGVVLDIFDKDEEVVETSWRMYNEIAEDED